MVSFQGIRLTYGEPLSRSLKRELKIELWGKTWIGNDKHEGSFQTKFVEKWMCLVEMN